MTAAATAGHRAGAATAKYGFVGDGTSSTSQTWNAAANWTLVSGTGTGGPPPTSADIAEFDSTDDGKLAGATVDTGADQSVLELILGETGRTLSQSFKIANNTITLGANATGTSPTTMARNGVGVQTIASAVLLGKSQTWNLAGTSGSVVVSGNIGELVAGSGISKQGTMTVQLSGTNTFSGVYATRGGTTVVGSASALGANATTLVSDPASTSDASLLTQTNISLGQNVTVLSGSSNAVTLGGNASQTGSTWTGTISLTRAVNLTGGTAGTVTFAGPIVDGAAGLSPTGSPYGFVNSNVTKVGAGTVSLTGENTYSGTTTVSAGTLLANNTAGSATGGGPVTVATGGTLGGNGSIGGTVVVNGTITAGPDAVTVGKLTTGDQTWNANGTVNGQFLAKATAADGSANDRVTVSGLTVAAGTAAGTQFTVNVSSGSTALTYSAPLVLAYDNGSDTSIANPFASTSVLQQLALVTNLAAPSGMKLQLDTQGDGSGVGYDLILDDVSAAPEPASLLLLGLAAAPLALGRRRRARGATR